ncbi:MAG: hypothetical protein HYR90_02345 [Candidatus Andersenbacteria bacterium]|nr:hypothetical protein [Candidatus Andersenbacteria bacterium]MBI3250999.1 hypothetical protein [Candidatus Andersenbacteria bacterium]
MLSLAHTLISLPFGVYVENPLLIFLSTFVFHLFLDTLLHWNFYPKSWGKLFIPFAALDVLTGLGLAYLIMGKAFLTTPILIAIIGGNLPDVFHMSWELLGPKWQNSSLLAWSKPIFRFHDSLQLETVKVAKGLIWQGIFVFSALVFLRIL